ncbi:isopentenyl phosphate kinase family protein [Thermococcus sp. CX2]|uniref:isopentenyl phosphate kinase n=1 Tax=Thermococcus sp. CX2 TaxID=163006 RepID=UPI00143941BF|nr:isopentenyl phosphate kinase [Thermococcus sp. CX2]NJE84922.1 isopentenyl phosphate kinase family protein [Thermococcus sp. CX2]
MIIVKLGGSVISDKNVEKSFHEDVVSQIASEIAQFYPKEDFIIVHGGGSYGHPLAKEYNLREGIEPNPESKRIGFSRTHQAMLELNGKIIEVFLERGLPAFSVSTSSVFITENGSVAYGDVEVLKRLIELKLIPVLFGDVAVDLEKGIDILSGDQIITYLAKMLRPSKVIFLMDVDGIYDGKPGEGGLIWELKAGEIDRLIERLSGSAGIDVTGGIANKLREAKEIAQFSEVWFVNGKVPGRLSGAIIGGGTGTKIMP